MNDSKNRTEFKPNRGEKKRANVPEIGRIL